MWAEETLQALGKQTELFDRAASFPGRTRERIVALSEAEELFFRLHPYHYRSLQLIRVASQVARTAASQRDVLRKCESRLISLLMGVIHDAVRVGDLEVTRPRRAEELAFSLWALAFGTRALMNTAVATLQLGVKDGFAVSRHATSALLDAMGWQPLSSEWDYEATRVRVSRELFPEEWRRVEAVPVPVEAPL